MTSISPQIQTCPPKKPYKGRPRLKKIKVDSRHELSTGQGDFPAPRCAARAAHPGREAREAAL